MPRTYWMKSLPPEQYAEEIKRRDALFAKVKALGIKHVELIRRMEERGLRTSKQELSGVLHGSRHGRKVDAMLDLIEEIVEEAGGERA